MKIKGSDKSLESYKIFPFVAWGLTFGFALFVYNITMELKEITTTLQEQTRELQEKVNAPIDEVDFGN